MADGFLTRSQIVHDILLFPSVLFQTAGPRPAHFTPIVLFW